MFFLFLILVYTLFLLLISQYSKRHTKNGGQFLDGGRSFGVWHVFVMMTAMWGSSMFAVELDSGYLTGLSAIWYGISVIVSSLLVASVLLRPFRRIGYLTNSNLLGRVYGKKARDLAALVIGLTFPIFAMKNVLAAATYFHVMLGWNLAVVLILTTLLVILYVSLGGLWSLAYVQIANLVLFTVGLVVAAYYSFHGNAVLTTTIPKQPHFQGLTGGGLAMILVWFGMNILNSVSAQAEFQTISSAKSVRKGKLGVYLSSIVLVGFAIVPTLLGMAARTHHIAMKSGLLAFPTYLRMVAPHWAVLLVGLGFWAAALIWCAPLMFSGASSFGLDLFNRKQQSHDTSAVRRFTRLSMFIQGALIVIYALIRPGELAWWAVFGLTLRNAAIVGPTLTFLLWPAVRERTVLLSMVVGVAGGLGWNALTGFSATTFAFHINPMWVGTGLSMTVIILGTFFENRKALQWNRQLKKRYLGWSIGAIGLLLIIASPALTHGAYRSLLGVDLFLSILCLFFTAMLSTELRDCANEAELSNCQRGICGKKIRRILESR